MSSLFQKNSIRVTPAYYKSHVLQSDEFTLLGGNRDVPIGKAMQAVIKKAFLDKSITQLQSVFPNIIVCPIKLQLNPITEITEPCYLTLEDTRRGLRMFSKRCTPRSTERLFDIRPSKFDTDSLPDILAASELFETGEAKLKQLFTSALLTADSRVEYALSGSSHESFPVSLDPEININDYWMLCNRDVSEHFIFNSRCRYAAFSTHGTRSILKLHEGARNWTILCTTAVMKDIEKQLRDQIATVFTQLICCGRDDLENLMLKCMLPEGQRATVSVRFHVLTPKLPTIRPPTVQSKKTLFGDWFSN